MASWRDRTAPFGWSRIRKTSVSRSQICNCSSHALCGPGFGVNELIDEATSERACSTLEAANDCACREPIGNHCRLILGDYYDRSIVIIDFPFKLIIRFLFNGMLE